MNNGLSTESSLNIEFYQKKIKKYQFLMASFLISIPILINFAGQAGLETWKTSVVILFVAACILYFYQTVQTCKKIVEEACYQLSVGSKVYKKYHTKRPQEVYFIFQEGHRYYYLENIKNGEKRLVAKERILQEYSI